MSRRFDALLSRQGDVDVLTDEVSGIIRRVAEGIRARQPKRSRTEQEQGATDDTALVKAHEDALRKQVVTVVRWFRTDRKRIASTLLEETGIEISESLLVDVVALRANAAGDTTGLDKLSDAVELITDATFEDAKIAGSPTQRSAFGRWMEHAVHIAAGRRTEMLPPHCATSSDPSHPPAEPAAKEKARQLPPPPPPPLPVAFLEQHGFLEPAQHAPNTLTRDTPNAESRPKHRTSKTRRRRSNSSSSSSSSTTSSSPSTRSSSSASSSDSSTSSSSSSSSSSGGRRRTVKKRRAKGTSAVTVRRTRDGSLSGSDGDDTTPVGTDVPVPAGRIKAVTVTTEELKLLLGAKSRRPPGQPHFAVATTGIDEACANRILAKCVSSKPGGLKEHFAVWLRVLAQNVPNTALAAMFGIDVADLNRRADGSTAELALRLVLWPPLVNPDLPSLLPSESPQPSEVNEQLPKSWNVTRFCALPFPLVACTSPRSSESMWHTVVFDLRGLPVLVSTAPAKSAEACWQAFEGSLWYNAFLKRTLPAGVAADDAVFFAPTGAFGDSDSDALMLPPEDDTSDGAVTQCRIVKALLAPAERTLQEMRRFALHPSLAHDVTPAESAGLVRAIALVASLDGGAMRRWDA